MNVHCILFGAIQLKKEEIEGKRVIEVGACDVNGSVRPLFESYKPKEYIGVDIAAGKGVDLICEAGALAAKFGSRSFDVVIATELLEHVRDWRSAIHNIKDICKPAGKVLITTRSFGFVYHGYPFDFWRFEIEDMEYIFKDFIIEKLEKDPEKGVLIKAKKPEDFKELDLSEYALYSIVADKRIKELTNNDLQSKSFKWMLYKLRVKTFLRRFI
jgi:SAM-dependent methyltransferase